MYLLDTNVISELRRARPQGAVVAWLRKIDSNKLNLSAVTFLEIQAGIELTRDRDAERAAVLEAWLAAIVQTFNVISIDGPAFRLCARMMHRRSETEFNDALIAACAIVNDLTVVTRNVRDFSRFDVATLNPFAKSPEA